MSGRCLLRQSSPTALSRDIRKFRRALPIAAVRTSWTGLRGWPAARQHPKHWSGRLNAICVLVSVSVAGDAVKMPPP